MNTETSEKPRFLNPTTIKAALYLIAGTTLGAVAADMVVNDVMRFPPDVKSTDLYIRWGLIALTNTIAGILPPSFYRLYKYLDGDPQAQAEFKQIDRWTLLAVLGGVSIGSVLADISVGEILNTVPPALRGLYLRETLVSLTNTVAAVAPPVVLNGFRSLRNLSTKR